MLFAWVPALLLKSFTVMQQGHAAGNDPPAMNFLAQPPDYTPAHAHANWLGQVRLW